MKKSLMLVGALMISSFIFAQRQGQHRESIQTVLSLDDAQYASVKEINKKYGEKHRAVFRDSTMKREDKVRAHQDIRQERESEINKVLTPEQSRKLQTIKTERRNARHERMEKRLSDREENLKTDLSMSDAQFAKFKAANKKSRDKMKELRDSGKADKASVKKIRDEHDAEVKSILKKDQYEKLQLIKKYSRRSQGNHPHGKFR